MSTFRRPSQNKRARQCWPRHLDAYTLDAVPVVTLSTNDVILTFVIPVVLKGIPACMVDDDVPGLSASQTAPNVIHVTYAGSVAAAETLTIRQRDPAVRTSTGGYMPQQVITFPQS